MFASDGAIIKDAWNVRRFCRQVLQPTHFPTSLLQPIMSSDGSSNAVASTSGGADTSKQGATSKMLLHRKLQQHPLYQISKMNKTLLVKYTTAEVDGYPQEDQHYKSVCTISSPGLEDVVVEGGLATNKQDAEQMAAEVMRKRIAEM